MKKQTIISMVFACLIAIYGLASASHAQIFVSNEIDNPNNA